MGGMAPPPTMPRHKMMMHMTFFWGKNALVLFKGWPGTSTGMYALALVFVFAMGILVEWLSHSRLIKPGTGNVAAGIIQTFMHTIRVGLANLVMLALMSFNVGVFLAAVAGHSLGFLLFGNMNDSHSHDPPPTKNGTGEMMMHLHKKMMMHMTFYWGNEAEVLFSGWPGKRAGMYALALIFVFTLGVIAEWLTHSWLIKEGTTNVAGRIIKTILHAIRVSLGYLLMLSLMSFNAGIFLAAVAGQALGFLLFGSKVFDKTEFPPYETPSESC
ncbi:hypothetical protein WN944_028174 [Citrus x changshan-huyou]